MVIWQNILLGVGGQTPLNKGQIGHYTNYKCDRQRVNIILTRPARWVGQGELKVKVQLHLLGMAL